MAATMPDKVEVHDDIGQAQAVIRADQQRRVDGFIAEAHALERKWRVHQVVIPFITEAGQVAAQIKVVAE